MRIGFGRLRLPPHDFWNLTAVELVQIATAFLPPMQPLLGRQGLDDLMRQFPDERDDDDIR
jgi:uncharacterized phage protein (TIGR02216 family)